MKHLTTLAMLLASTSLASAASNESFIAQIGGSNNAIVGQTSGNNKQKTISVGRHNTAVTSQQGAQGAGAGSRTEHLKHRSVRRLERLASRQAAATIRRAPFRLALVTTLRPRRPPAARRMAKGSAIRVRTVQRPVNLASVTRL